MTHEGRTRSPTWWGQTPRVSADCCFFRGCLDVLCILPLVCVGIIVALGRHYLGDIGGGGWGDTFYVAPLLGLAGVWLLVALILMISSGRGSPSQDRPTCIPFLLSLRLGLLIAFVGNNIMGGVWFLSEGVQEACSAFCRGDQIQHVLVFQTVLSSVAILQFFGLWCCCCSRKYPPMEPRNEALLQRTLELHVYKFMRTWCWPLVDNTGVDEHYESISRSFQELFNDVDFTFDDIQHFRNCLMTSILPLTTFYLVCICSMGASRLLRNGDGNSIGRGMRTRAC